MTNQNIYKILQDIFKNVWEQQKYAEVKNGVFLTMQLGILYVAIKSINDNNLDTLKIFTGLLSLNILITLLAFVPSLDNWDLIHNKSNDKIKNIFFFESTKHYTNKTLLEEIYNSSNFEREVENEKILLDLANQIVILSRITSKKFLIFKISFYLFLVILFCITTLYFGG